MKKCALCNEKKADKKNTHYLTDAIIRTCINYNGGNMRERGFYFNISNDSAFMKFGFQRNTPIEIVKRELNREPTDIDIENAKNNPYSVNDVFCKDCEDLFGKIEAPFITNIYAKISDLNLNQYPFISIEDSRLIRLFFILQFWRCHVCHTEIKLSQKIAQDFRTIINDFIHYDKVDEVRLKKYPMAVSFIVSLKQEDHTRHFVGMTNESNPYVIFMNDYVIQLYDDMKCVKYYSLYGLNTKESYKDYINYNEDKFKIQVIQDESWSQISDSYYHSEIIPMVKKEFVSIYSKTTGCRPSLIEIKNFVCYYEKNKKSLAFTDEMLQYTMNQYLKEIGFCYE